jgi:hypothetical protein
MLVISEVIIIIIIIIQDISFYDTFISSINKLPWGHIAYVKSFSSLLA